MAFWNRESDDGKAVPPTQVGRAESSSPAAAEPTASPVAHQPAVRQLLGRETTVTGKLSFNAPTRIDGVLNGEVRASDLLVIGEEGKVDGAVRARQLLVLGEVRGEVFVEGRTEIGASGRVFGTIRSKDLVVQPGAVLEGDCKIGQSS
ncbi:MAG: polymer-forming cytoskeletal protein [Candidatus Binatia bacterium]|nr:polymer-forming cytoskeletal protein [Candidatus Binatia bacterium]